MNEESSVLDVIEDKYHGLLEPVTISYSNVTVRRAFIVWMYCGQTNKFQEVCNYYHHLEALEEQMSEENRASSRLMEYELFANQPPTSAYLIRHFPKLYSESQLFQQNVGKIIPKPDDTSVMKLQELTTFDHANGASKTEILEASLMIRDYCKRTGKTLDGFLREFKEHTEICGLPNTVGNVSLYIKRKMVQTEIQLVASYATALESQENKDTLDNTCQPALASGARVNPVILRKGTSLRSDSLDNFATKNKTSKTAMSDISNVTPARDFLSKYENIDEILQPKIYSPGDNDYLFETLRCDVTDVPKESVRKFSDTNFMREDSVNLRNL
ncbi:uncharacterized protein [Battus philenor]|uniref:uncharacterized protein n=1 Tax=Battus philenor TaxID=42288 RepID=UPI0035CF892F